MTERKQVPEREMRSRTRRSFFVGVSSFAAGIAGLSWIFTRRDDDGIAWPIRRMLQWNEGVFRDFFSLRRRVPEVARVTGKEPRVNGDIGLGDEREFPAWRLRVVTPADGGAARELILKMDDLRMLPVTETSVNFKCVEGWSEDMTYKGVRFSDFLEAHQLGRMGPHMFFPYVGLETPDGGYYVSLDMESMLHPQTLLCYEMNGMPLSFDNGSPLRLIIPIKYGIKSLKQIGTIRFADSRLPDYWAERGYDWYAGL